MLISNELELEGIKKASDVAAIILKKAREYTKIGMSTLEIDEYCGALMKQMNATSAPQEAYKYPRYTCISINHEVAHGLAQPDRILKDGDLVNIDVSVVVDGFWSDNGGSFILGNDIHHHQKLVDASKSILKNAINQIKGGLKISDLGWFIEQSAKKYGYKTIRNLTGHGVGRNIHEEPKEIACFEDKSNNQRFRKNTIVAIETFISTRSTNAIETEDGWTLVGEDGGFVAQHEHTIMVTEAKPLILTSLNGIFD